MANLDLFSFFLIKDMDNFLLCEVQYEDCSMASLRFFMEKHLVPTYWVVFNKKLRKWLPLRFWQACPPPPKSSVHDINITKLPYVPLKRTEAMTSQKTFLAFQRFDTMNQWSMMTNTHSPNLVGIGSWEPEIWPYEYLISATEISVNWPGSKQLWTRPIYTDFKGAN